MKSLRRLRWIAGLGLVALGATAAAGVGAGSPDFAGDCDPQPSASTLCAAAGYGLHVREDAFGLSFRSPWTVPGVPTGDAARRASYPIETSLGRVVPTVVYVPDPAARVPGVVSVSLERAPAGDPLRLKAELGWSGRPSAAFDVGYRVSRRQVAFRAEERPTGMVAQPNGRRPGSTWEGAWTERLGPQASATVVLAGDRVQFDGRNPEATSGRVDLRLRAMDGWNVLVGVAGSNYADAANPELRKGVTSLGTELSAGGLSLLAVVRDESTLSTASGHGGRVALRGRQGGWQASLYADAQQQATVIELTGSGAVDLPRELVEAGLVAVSPETVVRVLRDRGPLLAQHGIGLGALRIDPLRVQGGVDLRWRDGGASRTEVGLLLAMDDLQGPSGARRGVLGQVQMSWRLLGETDVTASYANWSLQSEPLRDDSRSLFHLSLRSRL